MTLYKQFLSFKRNHEACENAIYKVLRIDLYNYQTISIENIYKKNYMAVIKWGVKYNEKMGKE